MIRFYFLILFYSMFPLAKQFLDKLPLNNFKTVAGIVGVALVLGLQQMGYLDDATATVLLTFSGILTGVGAGHKVLKATQQ